MDSVVAKKQGDAIYDDNFQIIGRKSLYESFKSLFRDGSIKL